MNDAAVKERSPWRDLATRSLSAAVMIAATLAALWAGQIVWAIFVIAIYCIMLWELVRLCEPTAPRRIRWGLAPLPMMFPLLVLAASAFTGVDLMAPASEGGSRGFFVQGYLGAMIALAAPVLSGTLLLRSGRGLWLGYGSVLAAATLFVAYAYTEHGWPGLLTLVSIVVISDTAGYFAGRALGGPKFWPAISPKKTWSGTIAGWVGAGVFGMIALPHFGLPIAAAGLVGVVVCLSAQFGDIAESAMKRRVGVKDASNLIPGHGGMLDRLDGLVAAACLAGIIAYLTGA